MILTHWSNHPLIHPLPTQRSKSLAPRSWGRVTRSPVTSHYDGGVFTSWPMGGRWLFPFPHGWQWCVGILGPEVRSTRRPANKADRWESSGKNQCDSMENPTLRILENHPMTCKWLRTIASFRGKSKDRVLGPLLFIDGPFRMAYTWEWS